MKDWLGRIKPDRIILALVLALVGRVVVFFVTPDPVPWFWRIAVVVMLLLSIIAYWLVRRIPKPMEVSFVDPLTMKSDVNRERYARIGLIAFVSLFNPQPPDGPRPSKEQISEWVKTNDYEAMDFRHSNLNTIIHAAESHKSKLKFCWLVTTEDTDESSGSEPYAPLLAQSMKEQYGFESCKFIYGPNTVISQENDLGVATSTRDLLKDIFTSAEQLGLQPKDVIVDITGAFRAVTLGAILACINKTRDVEIVGATYVYDEDGTLISVDPTTIIAPFESHLIEEN